MKYVRWIAVCVVVTLALGTMALAAGAQSSSNEKPKATDVGITDKEIHVAVIADVDSPLAPNLFKAAVDGMKGWAKYTNSKAGGGGLAGRKVVIDFLDSKLNPAETKNAQITACKNDVAAVGTSAVFLTSVDEMRNCKDSTGAVTGLPDIPFVSTALVQQCSDQSFPIAPPQVLCDTATDHPQTFQADVARGYYYLDKYGKDLHGVYVFGSDSKSARDASFASLGGLRDIGGVDQGIKSDEDFDISSRATQSEFTPVVQKMKSSGSNYGHPGERRGLRDLAPVVSQAEGGMVAHAVALLNWHRRHRFCANCGAPTESREAGHIRRCPRCGAEHHPRTDPVVIMLVHDGDRAILGRQAHWPQGRYSALAGFVEPGESLEEAVAREVREETGARVRDVTYRSSQPWPFPSSLMLGFIARWTAGEPVVGDGELEDVRWFTREEILSGSPKLPPRQAIARRLIEDWLGREAPDGGGGLAGDRPS